MRYFEPIGLILVLVAVAWEIFLVQPLGTLDIDIELYGIKEQLYVIWDALEAEDIAEFRADNYERFFQAYNPKSNVEWQLTIAQIIRYAFFFVGSVMIITAKFREASLS